MTQINLFPNWTHRHRKQTYVFQRKSVLTIHSWKARCWSWNSYTLATWCEELTHWKRPWCWERLKAGGEGDDRGWDGWMASPNWWTCVWASSRSWWWTGRPGMLQSMGLQRFGHNWANELTDSTNTWSMHTEALNGGLAPYSPSCSKFSCIW